MRRAITAFTERVRFHYKMWQDLEPYGGAFTWLKGFVKLRQVRRLQRLHNFDEWHIRPVEWKPYALEVSDCVNSLIKSQSLSRVVEVGCGLGGILNRIEHADTTGFDLDPKVIAAGRRLYPRVRFEVGSFAAIRDQEIDALILANVCHLIRADELRQTLQELLQRNRIHYLVVDTVPSPHCHNWDSLLPSGYVRHWESRPFVFGRRVFAYRKSAPPTRPAREIIIK